MPGKSRRRRGGGYGLAFGGGFLRGLGEQFAEGRKTRLEEKRLQQQYDYQQAQLELSKAQEERLKLGTERERIKTLDEQIAESGLMPVGVHPEDVGAGRLSGFTPGTQADLKQKNYQRLLDVGYPEAEAKRKSQLSPFGIAPKSIQEKLQAAAKARQEEAIKLETKEKEFELGYTETPGQTRAAAIAQEEEFQRRGLKAKPETPEQRTKREREEKAWRIKEGYEETPGQKRERDLETKDFVSSVQWISHLKEERANSLKALNREFAKQLVEPEMSQDQALAKLDPASGETEENKAELEAARKVYQKGLATIKTEYDDPIKEATQEIKERRRKPKQGPQTVLPPPEEPLSQASPPASPKIPSLILPSSLRSQGQQPTETTTPSPILPPQPKQGPPIGPPPRREPFTPFGATPPPPKKKTSWYDYKSSPGK